MIQLRKAARRLVPVLLVSAALAAAPVALHTHLVRSDPVANATVRTAPTSIQLWFSGPIQINVTTVRLTGPDGAAVDVAGPAMGEGANPPVFVVIRGQL